jgi:hypothetical protein
MSTKALRTANNRISTLVWKLHKAIESAKEQDISFNEVEAISKLAIDSYKLFLEYEVRYIITYYHIFKSNNVNFAHTYALPVFTYEQN